MKKYFILILIFIGVTSFTEWTSYTFVVPANWPNPLYDFAKNPLTKEKILLGRALFYDPILSRDNSISCASCHSPYAAFTHIDHPVSHGIDNRLGNRNSPALMNLAWQQSFMWDGAINHIEVQALAPITNPKEMDENLAHVIQKLQASTLYPNLFYQAFGDSIITGEHTLKAISQFMLTLVSSNSKYDSVMRQEAVFSAQELNGYKIFKKDCAACHSEPLFSNQQFENNGLAVDTQYRDIGRMRITKLASDSLKFKVPTLRNIEYSYPYMHDGRFKKLAEVIKHYNSGVEHSATLSKFLRKPLNLDDHEQVDLIAFLLTLSDRSFVFNDAYVYPKRLFFPFTQVNQ